MILICSNVFGDFDAVNALTQPINRAYAVANNCDFLVDTEKRCGKDAKSFWWEKIAFLRTLLSSRAEGDMIVWLDVDSIIQSKAVIADILTADKDFGMVPIYNGEVQQKWYNAGVIAMRNNAIVRNFVETVWSRRKKDQDDEIAIAIELPKSMVRFLALDPKWNCWENNKHLVSEPSILTFHGIYPTSAKVAAIQSSIG